MVAKAKAKIDWSRLDAMTEEDIADRVAGNPDAAPLLTDEEIERALFTNRLRANRATRTSARTPSPNARRPPSRTPLGTPRQSLSDAYFQ